MFDSRFQLMTLRSLVLVFAMILVFNRTGRAEWVQTLTAESPRTPKIFSLAFAGPYLLAAFESGVFRSSDQGKTWIHPTMGITNSTTVFSLASRGSTVFAGTVSEGVYRSADYGQTWTQAGLGGEYVTAIALLDGAVLAATCCHGLFRSTDDGVTWTHPNSETGYFNDIATSGAFLFAGSTNGLFRSNDQGLSWAHIPLSAGRSDSTVGPFAVIGTTLFAAAHQNLYRSIDNGGTWTKTPLEATYIQVLTANGNNLFVATNLGLYQSSDRGDTWVTIDSGLPGNLVKPANILCLAVSGENLFTGVAMAGVWRRPLSEISTAITPTHVLGLKVNSGYRSYFGTRGFNSRMGRILQSDPITGFHLNGRSIKLP